MNEQPRAAVMEELRRQHGLFLGQLPALLSEHEGQFVLFHDGAAEAFFPTQEDALRSGKARYGLGRFLVQRVQANDPIPMTAAIGLWARPT